RRTLVDDLWSGWSIFANKPTTSTAQFVDAVAESLDLGLVSSSVVAIQGEAGATTELWTAFAQNIAFRRRWHGPSNDSLRELLGECLNTRRELLLPANATLYRARVCPDGIDNFGHN